MIITIIILSILLVTSIAANIILIWFNRQAVGKILFVSDNIGDVMGLVKEYQEHLESLYEMEMFYGEPTLEGLINHTKFIVGEINTFEGIYSLTREEDDTEAYDRTTETQDQEETKEA